MNLNIGDIIYMKKQHPCGSHEWEILRSGADFKIKCTKCGRLVMIPRVKLEKAVRRIVSTGSEE